MSIATAEAGRDTVGRDAVRSPGLMLAMATIGFAVNFWAWALLSPLARCSVPRARWAPSPSPTRRSWWRCRSSSVPSAGSP